MLASSSATGLPEAIKNDAGFLSTFKNVFSSENLNTVSNIGKTWRDLKMGGTVRPSGESKAFFLGNANPPPNLSPTEKIFSKPAQDNSSAVFNLSGKTPWLLIAVGAILLMAVAFKR